MRGELRPGGSEREWCDAEVLRRLRRASLAALRKEIEPADERAFARFLPSWQGVDRHPPGGAGPDRLREVLVPLQGLALPVEAWEKDVLPRRVGAWSPTWLDQLCSAGELVWVGAGAIGRRSGRVALYFREDAPLLGAPKRPDPPATEDHEAIRARLARRRVLLHRPARRRAAGPGHAAGGPVGPGVGGRGHQRRLGAAARAAAHAGPRPPRAPAPGPPRFSSRRSGASAQVQGRWSLTAPLFEPAAEPGQRRRAQAELLLERYGIVTREQVLAEGIPGGFSTLYDSLSALETLGVARRGYFVEGLGGAQFALPGAVERLRASGGVELDETPPLVLAATDPAQPYGAALSWPKRDDDRRPQRVAGAYVVLAGAEPVLYVERGGKGLLTLVGDDDARIEPALRALADAVLNGRMGKLGVERVDGEAVVGSPWEERLLELGFRLGPRKLTLSA